MESDKDLTADEKRFLEALFKRLGGDPAGKISMYAVGEDLGMERAEASRAAEALMAWGLVEIRSLSGAIGITAEGAAAAGGGPSHGDAPRLGDGPVMAPLAGEAVASLVAAIEKMSGGEPESDPDLSELLADSRTVAAQLASPRPKTAVIRACLEAIAANPRTDSFQRSLAGEIVGNG